MTDTMLFGILKMPFEMAMKDEISRIQFYARVQELVGRFEAQQQAEPVLQEIEQYRMQMAGISTAAIGYWKEGDGIHPDYDTLALRDVAKLYAKYDELYKAQPEQQAEPVAKLFGSLPVYDTTSPQRKELSASEILNMMPSTIPAEYDGPLMEFARAVEAKLKEQP